MSDWLPAEQWEEATAPLTSGSAQRSPQLLKDVVEQFMVEVHPRYRQNGEQTWCNRFVTDVTKALGCEVPHWLLGKEMRANDMQDWLLSPRGRRAGWEQCSPLDARAYTGRGLPCVVTYKNLSGHSGHIALYVPTGILNLGPYIAQAGKENFSSGPLERGFSTLPTASFFHS